LEACYIEREGQLDARSLREEVTMPRADIRFINSTIKQSTSNIRSRLVSVDGADELSTYVEHELNKWAEDTMSTLNPITVTVHMEGGRKVKVRATVSIGVELYPDALKKLGAAPRRRRAPKPFKVEFGDAGHNYLCDARTSELKSDNMGVSRLKVEGLIDRSGGITDEGNRVLDELESTPLEEVEDRVCENLLRVHGGHEVRHCTSDYLTNKQLIQVCGRFLTSRFHKYELTQEGVEWLKANVVRLRPVLNATSTLIGDALQFYPLEELNEDLVHEHEWIREAAQKRVEELKKEETDEPS